MKTTKKVLSILLCALLLTLSVSVCFVSFAADASGVKAALAALKNAVEISNHYKRFPESEEGFNEWCAKADALYQKIGKIR